VGAANELIYSLRALVCQTCRPAHRWFHWLVDCFFRYPSSRCNPGNALGEHLRFILTLLALSVFFQFCTTTLFLIARCIKNRFAECQWSH